jgi:hypothetical protein
MISSALVFSSQFRSVCLFHISYYTVRHLHACIPFFPSIRGSRDKPREFNLKSNLYYYYSCFFPPFYTLFLYLNNAMVCQVHNCMQSLSTLFVPIHAGSSILPTPSITVLPRENRLPLEPFAAGAREQVIHCKASHLSLSPPILGAPKP